MPRIRAIFIQSVSLAERKQLNRHFAAGSPWTKLDCSKSVRHFSQYLWSPLFLLRSDGNQSRKQYFAKKAAFVVSPMPVLVTLQTEIRAPGVAVQPVAWDGGTSQNICWFQSNQMTQLQACFRSKQIIYREVSQVMKPTVYAILWVWDSSSAGALLPRFLRKCFEGSTSVFNETWLLL